MQVTFFCLGQDGCLGLFCVGHYFTWWEVHLCDFGHSQLWSYTPKNRTTQTLHNININKKQMTLPKQNNFNHFQFILLYISQFDMDF